MTRRALLAGIAGLSLAVASCSRGEAAARSPAAKATRIISLAPSMTEALFAVGAGDRLVGRSRFCDFPPQAHALPVVGDVNPDLEAILALRPDLVVGISALSAARLVDQLGARKIDTWFPETSSLAAIDALILGLGERVGRVPDARKVVDSLDARENAVKRSVAGEARPRVLMVVSVGPVVAAGPASFADELIREAGGQNVVRDGGAWPTIGFETIVEMAPDIVIDATMVGTGGPSRITSRAAGWSGIRAVQDGHVVLIQDERVLRAGPRIAEGLSVLARTLHPDAAVPQDGW